LKLLLQALRRFDAPHFMPKARARERPNPDPIRIEPELAYSCSVRRAFVILSLATSACGRCSDGLGDEPADERACASACATLVGAGCEPAGLTPADAPRCVAACLARGEQQQAWGCTEQRRTYLGCVGGARVDCDQLRSAAAVSIEQREGIAGCAREHAQYMTCIAPCLHAGTEHLAERTLSIGGRQRYVQAQSVRHGCSACPGELARGAAPGSACQSPKVCAERCCSCPDGRVRFSTRVCADASCAADDACELARALGPDPCVATGAPGQPR
jgi:hypothetical protein